MTTTDKPRKFGTFDLPIGREQSTGGARREFKNMWGEDFRGDDDDIRTLAKEVPTSNDLLVMKNRHQDPPFGTTSRCEILLWLMRERC